MKTRQSSWLACAAVIGALASGSAQASWKFDTGSTTYGININNLACTVQGAGDSCPATAPTVTLSGFYAANSTVAGVADVATGNWTANALDNYGGNGLGMTVSPDTLGSAPGHALDNNGSTEAVLLKFSASVALTQIGIGWGPRSGYDSDISLFRWVDPGNGTPEGKLAGTAAGSTGNASSGWQLVGNYGNLAQDTSYAYNLVNSGNLASSWWLISAYNSGFAGGTNTTSTNGAGIGNGNDYFKLYAVAGTCQYANCTPPLKAPEPGSLALVGLSLVGATALQRRRQRKA